ncbi:MAG: sugar phosphate isomerase/epimerase [Ruminococcaceae bacterium]|nr:sugar phosphate isomerase/epimerase [Oscillospiraceae bacterium]
MLLSTQTHMAVERFGLFEGIRLLMDAGYPALDLTMFVNNEYLFAPDMKSTAVRLKTMADERGVIFNQAHAPFGGGYDHYTKNLLPLMPRVFEFASYLGIDHVIVHPLQKGRYYGREAELFEMNREFYASLAPIAQSTGVKIAIENMWQTHPITHRICDDVAAPPEELAAYYDAQNRPDLFTVCLDLGHVALCGREPEDAIRTIGHDRLGALHVHDVNYISDDHTLPGMGRINWDAVLKALADIDYQGDFTFEADNFLIRYPKEFYPTAAKFMCDCGKYLLSRFEAIKTEKVGQA